MQDKSTAELLAILGLGEAKTGLSLYEAARMGVDELKASGLTHREAERLCVALELGRRSMQVKDVRPKLRTPTEIAAYLSPIMAGKTNEEFHVLCFNARNVLIRDEVVARGTSNVCPVDPRELFRTILTTKGTSAVVLTHNHPSGDPEPSSLDVSLTVQVVEGGRLLGIRVLDHVVLGEAGSFCSFLERGLMPATEARAWNAAQKGRW